MKGMGCSKAEKRILQDLDEGLGGRERERIEDHLRDCESCRSFRLEMGEMLGSVAADVPEDPGEQFWKMYQVSLDAKLKERELSPGAALGWGWKAAGALVGACLVVAVVWLGPWQEPTPALGDTQRMVALLDDLTRLYGPLEPEDSYDDAAGEQTLGTAYSQVDPERLTFAPWFEVEEESNHLLL